MKRILIVDDHEMIRRGIKVLVQKSHVVCGEAAEGNEAVARAQELKPDRIVLDVSMPRMDGVQAFNRIRALVPEARIILYTIYPPEALRSSGADAVVSKHADSARLLETIDKVA